MTSTIAAYARVSTAKQYTNNGTASQEDVIRRWLQARNINPGDPALVHWFIEERGVSGRKTKSRPKLAELRADATAGKVSEVVAHSFSRLFRSVKDAAEYIAWSLDLELKTTCVSDGFVLDPASPFSRAMAQIAAVFAELEAVLKAEAASNGIQAKLARGERHGPATVRKGKHGYRQLTDLQLGSLLAEDRRQPYSTIAARYGVHPTTVMRKWARADKVRTGAGQP